jgi:hypothetical protein
MAESTFFAPARYFATETYCGQPSATAPSTNKSASSKPLWFLEGARALRAGSLVYIELLSCGILAKQSQRGQ